MSTSYQSLKKPTWKAPSGDPGWETLPLDEALAELQKHLQTAIILELYTIPLYLFAAYSINGDSASTRKIIGIVIQEMLHLGLAGNILCSIDGTPKVYGNEFTPKYPREIFFEKLEMNLNAATKATIQTFVDLEEPLEPSNEKVAVPDVPLLPQYKSIGQFYESLRQGLIMLDQRYKEAGKVLFNPQTFDKQFQPADNSWSDDDMKVIIDIEAAKTSINLIITQGEGAIAGGPPPSGPSHYEIFKSLLATDIKTWPVVENPITSKFEGQEIHKVMVACDAAYCYLLLTIQKLWTYGGGLRGDIVSTNIFPIMLSVLKPMAHFLVQQPAGPDFPGQNAAAAFNRHDFGPQPLKELQELTAVALAAFPNEPKLQAVKGPVEGLIDIDTLK